MVIGSVKMVAKDSILRHMPGSAVTLSEDATQPAEPPTFARSPLVVTAIVVTAELGAACVRTTEIGDGVRS